MAKLLFALEGINNANKHDIVSDLLKHDRDNAISFLNVSDPHFRKIYCEVNGILPLPPYSKSKHRLKHRSRDCLI